MVKLNVPRFKDFNEACVYAHRYWDCLPKNPTDLKTVMKIGSKSRWMKFVKGRSLFLRLRQSQTPRLQALEQVYKSYKIRLKDVKSWQATKGTPGLRKGPTESTVNRKQKPGPKSKYSAGTLAAIRQYADKHDDAPYTEIADFANQRLSQATDDELSQLSQDIGRVKTMKGKFKLNFTPNSLNF